MVLAEKIALVTGAGRGMGRAIALQYAQAGAAIAAVDVDGQTAQETSATIEAAGGRSLPIQADVGELASIERMVQQTVETFGRLDVMVNNAGVTRYLNIMEVTEADWDRIHRVNAKGVFFCMQRAAQQMIAQGQGGRIVNIASIAGKGYAGTSNAAYAASKGAVIAMTMIAAHQLGRYDINVNAICPGVTRTAMSQASMVQRAEMLGVTVEEMERRRLEIIPIRRANDPEDIAAMAVFLASPGARNITGQAFNVDGGLIMS
jgi:NAD(P)-dependent dehydrogenase (short-subunit alcohol dehydrogenase family)